MTKILFLEDDRLYAETVNEYLDECGFDVDVVYTGNKAIDKCYEKVYDLYLIDLNVPNIHGFEVLTMLRSLSEQKPILVLTSRNSDDDVIKAFTLGCTDYLKKPCSLLEIHTRVVASLKRSYGTREEKLFIKEGLYFDTVNKKLLNEDKVVLGKTDTQLLSIFLQSPQTIISYEELISQLYPANKEINESTLRYHIHALRKLLGENIIVSYRAQGYMLCLPR